MSMKERVRLANWHITSHCNYQCKFCFASCMGKDVRDSTQQRAVLENLCRLGIQKINFVGGEPLLHPDLPRLCEEAKGLGMITSIVTNGSLLLPKLGQMAENLDWVGVSVDSCNEYIEMRLGRGSGNHVDGSVKLCDAIKANGINLKVNTTVTKLNWSEDMTPFIERVEPRRWKVFQFLRIQGQNEEHADEMEISTNQFDAYIAMNKGIVLKGGARPVFERSEDMMDSYIIIDPEGRFVTNRNGRHEVVILDSLDPESLDKVINPEKYLSRGGLYDWKKVQYV